METETAFLAGQKFRGFQLALKAKSLVPSPAIPSVTRDIILDVRRISRLARLISLLCASGPVLFQQDRTPVADSDRNAIYSWVIDHLTNQEKLVLIAPETEPGEYPYEGCLEVPRDRATDFREIRSDFDRRKNTTREFPRSLSTSKAYVILDPTVAKEVILKSPLLSESPIIRERYPGAEHLLIFSDAYFNQKRSVALVHVNWWCGGLCGRPTWIAFEKGGDGVWQMRPWARSCIVVVEQNSAKIIPVVASEICRDTLTSRFISPPTRSAPVL